MGTERPIRSQDIGNGVAIARLKIPNRTSRSWVRASRVARSHLQPHQRP
jgi:hypothetical protein